ncbi:MAG: branched-chain amino acid transport system substrate-binding protein [Alphaproteobacteria bacterium]|jgi:branched-chain amino acid transport system substrate-binding protein
MRMVKGIWLASVALFAMLSGGALPGVAVAASCSEIAVGAVLSLTGRYSTAGVLTRDGYEFAIRQIRDAGGMRVGDKCYNLRVVYRDDESSPERGVLVALRLIEEDRVRFMLGPNSAAVADAIADLTETARIPMLTAQGMPRSSLAKGRKYLFGLLTASDQHLAAGLEFAAKMVLDSDRSKASVKIAVVSGKEPYMADLRRGLLQLAASQKLNVVVDEKLTDDFVNLPTILSKVRQTKADVLLVAAHAKAVARVAQQIEGMPAHLPIMAMTHCEAGNIATKASDAASRILCAARKTETNLSPVGLLRDRAAFDKAFKGHFKAYAGRAIPDAAAQAALAVYVYADAFRRARSRDNEKVRAALQDTRMSTFFGYLDFAEGGNAVAVPMVWRQIQGGKYRIVAPADVATHQFQSPRSGL